jgi:hypothetical protein
MSDDQEKYESITEGLAALGVPEDVIAYLLSMRPSRWLSFIHDFLVLILLVLGFAVGAVLWVLLAQYSEAAAIEHAKVIGGVMYEDIYGFSGLTALFGWIFAAGFISSSPAIIPDRMVASAFAYSMTKDTKYAISWRRAFAKADKTLTPDALVKNVFSHQGKWGKWPAVVLFMLAFLLVDFEMRFHTIYTYDGMTGRSNYGFGDWVATPWSDAISVELGCNHITGKSPSDDPVYKITFKDGRSIRLDNARPTSGSWIDGIEVVDAVLIRTGVEFKRWSWRDRNPLHPKCLAANQRKMTPDDYARLLKVLRVMPDETAPP